MRRPTRGISGNQAPAPFHVKTTKALNLGCLIGKVYRQMDMYLRNRDELYIINLERLMYIEADDHYANIFYTTGAQFMVPFSLSKIESAMLPIPYIIRAGRKYMMNIKHVVGINSVKHVVMFLDDKGVSLNIKLSKEAVKEILMHLSKTCVGDMGVFAAKGEDED